ncbi:MAG: rRNA cytosine-C5-methylase, partial [Rhodospirillales bacterium]
MTPSARISAIIDLLGQIEQPGTHANKTISKYFRNRRYIGSKDRRAISDSIFNILRHHARLLWWTNDGIARLRTLASLVLLDRKSQQEVIDLFNGDGYAPPSLTPSELKLLKSCMGKSVNDPSMPLWLSSEVPEWLLNDMQPNWSLDLIEETNALNQPA